MHIEDVTRILWALVALLPAVVLILAGYNGLLWAPAGASMVYGLSVLFNFSDYR